jgi:Ser-tRNA(Ala) deacylase AlaX
MRRYRIWSVVYAIPCGGAHDSLTREIGPLPAKLSSEENQPL